VSELEYLRIEMELVLNGRWCVSEYVEYKFGMKILCSIGNCMDALILTNLILQLKRKYVWNVFTIQRYLKVEEDVEMIDNQSHN